jgi:hypothetical protein
MRSATVGMLRRKGGTIGPLRGVAPASHEAGVLGGRLNGVSIVVDRGGLTATASRIMKQ